MRSIPLAKWLAAVGVTTGACGVDQQAHEDMLANFRKQQREMLDVQQRLADRDKKAADLEARLRSLEGEKGTLAEELQRKEQEKARVEQKLGATEREAEEERRAREAVESRNQVYQEVAAKLAALAGKGQLQVDRRKGRVLITLPEKLLFDKGKAELRKDGEKVLEQVAGVLKGIPDRDFLISAHTDDSEPKKRKFKSNWHLSSVRAVEVVQFLESQGVAPGHLAAAGYGQHDPVGDNKSEAGATANRRVEIALMPTPDELPRLE